MNIPSVNTASGTQQLTAEGLDEIIRAHLREQNNLEYELGDKLDTKMNIALVVITFLATQSAAFLALSHMPKHWHVVQVISVMLTALAGVAALYGLIPRIYYVGQTPDEFIKWVEGVKEFYSTTGQPDAQTKSIKFLHRKSIEQLRERFSRNRPLNAQKSTLVSCSYYLTAGALGLNLLTLAALASRWYF